MRRTVTPVARALMALALLLTAPTAVFAHAELDTALPGPDQLVRVVPDELVATFTQAVDPGRSSLVLLDESGQEIARGAADPEDPTVMRMALPNLEDGVYEVRWRTFSAEDLDEATGTYTFLVALPTPSPSLSPSPPEEPTGSPAPTDSPSPSPDPSTTPSAAPTPSGDGDGTAALVPIAAAVAVAAGLGVWLLRSRRP